jgi:hypothetical protein
MRQLILNLNDQSLETALNSMAQEQGKDITDVIINVLQHFIKQKSRFPVKKLDPFRHSTQIQYWVEEDLNEVKPFAQVKNSAQFGRELRENLWERTTHG